jgi:hypothetical protein
LSKSGFFCRTTLPPKKPRSKRKSFNINELKIKCALAQLWQQPLQNSNAARKIYPGFREPGCRKSGRTPPYRNSKPATQQPSEQETNMKKITTIITLAVIIALFSFNPLWAKGGGQGQAMQAGSAAQHGLAAQDGTMQDADLSDTVTISGIVYDTGSEGSGLSIDEGDGQITTVYGTGSMIFWTGLGIEKPAVGEQLEVEAVEIVFSDGTTRLIALSMTLEDGTVVTLRDEDGRPAWRGGQGQGQNQGQNQGGNNGDCPLVPAE